MDLRVKRIGYAHGNAIRLAKIIEEMDEKGAPVSEMADQVANGINHLYNEYFEEPPRTVSPKAYPGN